MDKLFSEDRRPPEKFPKSDHIDPGSDGWLSPKGDYYKVNSTEHDESSTYLVANSSEVQNEVKRRSGYPYFSLTVDYRSMPDRMKLKELGWVLIRGNVLYSDEASNYTPSQLKSITEAGIQIINAFDGSQEYSSDKTLKWANEAIKKLDEVPKIDEIKKIVAEHSNDPYSFEAETLTSMEDFRKDPFHTEIHTESVSSDDDVFSENIGEGSLPAEIFNKLSEDYSDEMIVFNGRHSYCFRLLDIGDKQKLMAQARIYNHDGLSSDIHGAVENWISVYVIDEFTLPDKIQRIISHGTKDYPKHGVTMSKENGYFTNLWQKIPDRMKDKFPLSFAHDKI